MKKLILLLPIFLFLLTQEISAQIFYQSNGISSFTNTVSLTVPAGNDRLLIVSLGNTSNSGTITFNGLNMSLISSVGYLPLGTGPAITSNINVTQSGFKALLAASFTGIDQIAPLGNSTFSSGNAAIASNPGNLIISKIRGDSGTAATIPGYLNLANYLDNGSNEMGSLNAGIAGSACTSSGYGRCSCNQTMAEFVASGSTGTSGPCKVGDAPTPINVSPTISLVDANGDGTPDITDPCSCSDMMNITDGSNITYFHDFIQISSDPGETWEITAYNSGGLHFSNGVLLPIGTVIPEITPGVYYLDVWHPDATGFDADFDRTAGGVAFSLNTANSCNNSDCANVPTLSTWGIICMCLFLMSFGSIVLIRQSELSLANHTSEFSMKSAFQNPPMNRSILGKMILATIALSVLAGVITFAVYGSIAMIDVIGFMIAGPLFAYLMHLMMMQLNKQ